MTQTTLETHQIPSPRRTLAPRSKELDEDSILRIHGEVIWNALQAFQTDPIIVAEMVDAANLAEYRREILGRDKAGRGTFEEWLNSRR